MKIEVGGGGGVLLNIFKNFGESMERLISFFLEFFFLQNLIYQFWLLIKKHLFN